MNTRNSIALALIVISLICLYPGLVYPILSIEISNIMNFMHNSWGNKLPMVSPYDVEEALSAEITVDTGSDSSTRQYAQIEPTEQPEDSQESAQTTPAGEVPETYTVVSGDTYACIAERFYGNYRVWPEIAALNQGRGFNERFLYVDAVLTMPELASAQQTTSICNS